MKRDNDMKSYAVEELKAMPKDSRTDWSKADALTDQVERRIAEDEDERDMRPDWTRAELVLPQDVGHGCPTYLAGYP